MDKIAELEVLANDRVRIRPWRLDDAAVIQEASHDALIPVITTVPVNATEADAMAFIERQWGRPTTDMAHARAIADPHSDEALGHLFISFIFQWVGRATMGYWIVDRARRQGLASTAVDLASRWLLTEAGMRRVTLFIEPANLSSIATARRAGFSEDGLLRAWETYADGKPRDMLAFGRTRRDLETA